MATCAHGLPSGQCLICSTLGTTTDERRTAAIPAGPAQLVGSAGEARAAARRARASARARPRRVAPRLVGGLLALVVVALLGWWILGVVWAVLRLVELVAIGVGCGYLGYRVGVVSGRHQARQEGKARQEEKVRR